MLTKDHILPVSLGGSDELDNLQTMCDKCNSKKGNKIPESMLHLVDPKYDGGGNFMGYQKKYEVLPNDEERLEMAKFINARKGYEIGWLLENVYRLIPMYIEQRRKEKKEAIENSRESRKKYFEQNRDLQEASLIETQKPLFIKEDGIEYVLVDGGVYEEVIN